MELQKKEAVNDVMGEFIDAFDELVFCLHLSSRGMEMVGEDMAKNKVHDDQQTWIGSNLEVKPKFHARIKTLECIEKSKKDGHFSNVVAKSLLCTMYSSWDEDFRHRVAAAAGYEAAYLECPLMGDLRKIRHCVIHKKSIVPKGGLKFEVLKWDLPEGPLKISFNMFLEFNDEVRGSGMRISGFSLPSGIKGLLPEMTAKERESFDDFAKKRENRIKGIEWPGLDSFLQRIGRSKY